VAQAATQQQLLSAAAATAAPVLVWEGRPEHIQVAVEETADMAVAVQPGNVFMGLAVAVAQVVIPGQAARDRNTDV
jgi:L-cysteine desulfidase